MKNKIVLILLCLFICPLLINADECDSNGVVLESIKVVSINKSLKEFSDAVASNRKINLDLEVYDPGDSIVYELRVKNNLSYDFSFKDESLLLNTDYLSYQFSYDGNNVLKAGGEKVLRLKVEYKNRVPIEKLEGGLLSDIGKMNIALNAKNEINDIITNPATGINISLFIVCIILIVSITTVLKIRINQSVNNIVLILVPAFMIPVCVNAVCDYSIELDAKIRIFGYEAIFQTGSEVNIKMKNLAGDNVSSYNTADTNITAIQYSATPPTSANMTSNNIVSTSDSDIPIYMWYDNGTIYWWSEDSTPSLNSDASQMFRNMSNLVNVSGLENFDASGASNFQGAFGYLSSITDLTPLAAWDVSNVTNMLGTFGYNLLLENLSFLRNWDVSNVTNMSTMLAHNQITSLEPLRNWDVSNVTNMGWMFSACLSLNNLNGLENWDVSNVTNMSSMFMGKSDIGAMKLEDISALSNWNVSNVTDMSYMFQRNWGLTDLNALKNWDVSSATNMKGMFINDSSLTNLSGLSNWDVSNVLSMYAMFEGCQSLINLNGLSNWNVSNVTDMSYMFRSNSVLTDASGVNGWNIKSTAGFTKMFNNTPVHPTFTRVSGTWNSEGTFVPS